LTRSYTDAVKLFHLIQKSRKVSFSGALLIFVVVVGCAWWLKRGADSTNSLFGNVLHSKKSQTQGTEGNESVNHLDSRADREKKLRAKERLKTLRRNADDSERTQKAAFAANPPLIVAISPGGRLTTSAIEKLGLTETEVDSLTNAITSVRDSASADFVKRLKLTDSSASDDGTIYKYFARARPDRGKEYLDALSHQFEAAIGKERSQKLMSSVVNEDINPGLGHYDLEIEILKTTEGATVKYNYFNPKSGGLTRYGESTIDDFNKKFGNVFDAFDNK
jgi:hypothetical protein